MEESPALTENEESRVAPTPRSAGMGARGDNPEPGSKMLKDTSGAAVADRDEAAEGPEAKLARGDRTAGGQRVEGPTERH